LATSYGNVGCSYDELGQWSRALKYKLKALGIRERVLPADHPDLATSYNNVGCSYGKLGQWNRALKYILRALEMREKALPPEHPDLTLTYNNLSVIYQQLGISSLPRSTGDWQRGDEVR
jgi:tetratricopeptide (TPR) repeat protein